MHELAQATKARPADHLSGMSVFVLSVMAALGAAPSGYDPHVAQRLIAYADAAYCGDKAHGGTDTYTKWDCPPCSLVPDFSLDAVLASPLHQTFALAGVDGMLDAPVLSFRGSVLPLNYVDDMDTVRVAWWPTSSGGGTYARGFLRSYSSLQAQAFAAVRRLVSQKPGRPVYVTGHSLGAAQSTLAALDLAANFTATQFVLVNFGALRVGDAVAARFHAAMPNLRTWRVVHRADAAPQGVKRDGLSGFTHVPTEVWYPDGCRDDPLCSKPAGTAPFDFVVCDGSGEDPHCQDSVAANVTNMKDHDLYLNHSMWCCAGDATVCNFPFSGGPTPAPHARALVTHRALNRRL